MSTWKQASRGTHPSFLLLNWPQEAWGSVAPSVEVEALNSGAKGCRFKSVLQAFWRLSCSAFSVCVFLLQLTHSSLLLCPYVCPLPPYRFWLGCLTGSASSEVYTLVSDPMISCFYFYIFHTQTFFRKTFSWIQ